MSDIKPLKSTSPTEPTEPKTPDGPNWTALEAKVAKIEAYLCELAGKEGYNPYMWAHKNKFDTTKAQLANKDVACVSVINSWPDEPNCKVKSAGPRQIVSELKSTIKARQEIPIPSLRRS